MYNNRVFLSVVIVVLLYPLSVFAYHDMTDIDRNPESDGVLELVMNNMDRYQYVIFVDGNMAGNIEGYAGIQPKTWHLLVKKVSGTLLVENLASGTHTVRIEVNHDPDMDKAKSREEFLTGYHPLVFEVNIDGRTRHEVDADAVFESRVVVSHDLVYHKKKDWQSFAEEIDGRKVEVKLQLYRKDGKLGRAERRLNIKGKWEKAKKYVFYFNVGVTVDGEIVHTEKETPFGGRIEYRYWEFVHSKWFDDAFIEDTIKDRHIGFAEAVKLTDQHEFRISGSGDTVLFTILRIDTTNQTTPSE